MLAGHDVVGVSSAPTDFPWVADIARTRFVNRLLGHETKARLLRKAVAAAADLYVPIQETSQELALAAALATDAAATSRPEWEQIPTTSIWRTPLEPSLCEPAGGMGPAMHVPGWKQTSTQPAKGQVFVAYRRTERNPGRYLEEGFRSLGLSVTHVEAIDWEAISPDALGVFVVESQLPGLPIRGTNPGVPVVFWVHHGEHHLYSNLRLQQRYGAHGVALAHSWHLAYRFTGIVERVPFGAAPEITQPEFRPHEKRRYDVGFVGSPPDNGRYQERSRLLTDLRSELGTDSVATADNLTPTQMMNMYRDSRIVPDDGWGRHLPITMRVFEATGAGATLVTRQAPGLDLLLEPNRDFLPMRDDSFTQLVGLAKNATEKQARSGHGQVWKRHTYRHRASSFLELATRVRSESIDPPVVTTPKGPSGCVSRFPDAQRVLDLGGGVAGGLPDREVWGFDQASDRAEPGTFHASVVIEGNYADRERAIRAARLAVITPSGLVEELEDLVSQHHGEYLHTECGEWSIFSFGSSGYRASSDPDHVSVP